MVATALEVCSAFFCIFGRSSWDKMAQSLREAIIDELLRLGVSIELIQLIFPARGTASNDCITQIERVLRFVAGLIWDMLAPGQEVAGPHLLSRAVEALIGERPQAQWTGDLALGDGRWAVPSPVPLPHYRKRRKGRKADQACALEHAQGAGPQDEDDGGDPDEDCEGEGEEEDQE